MMGRPKIKRSLESNSDHLAIDLCEELICGLTRNGWELNVIGVRASAGLMNWVASGTRGQAQLRVQGSTKLEVLLKVTHQATSG